MAKVIRGRKFAEDHLIGIRAEDGIWAISVRQLSGLRVRRRKNNEFRDLRISMCNGDRLTVNDLDEAMRIMTNISRCFMSMGGLTFHDANMISK